MTKRRGKRLTYPEDVMHQIVKETVIRMSLVGGQVLADSFGFTPAQRRAWVDMTLFHADPANAGKTYQGETAVNA